MLADTVASFVNSHRGSLTNELQQSAIHQRWSCPHFAMDPDVSAWFRPGSNRGPFACEANVITTTLRNRCALAARYVDRLLGTWSSVAGVRVVAFRKTVPCVRIELTTFRL